MEELHPDVNGLSMGGIIANFSEARFVRVSGVLILSIKGHA